MKLQALTQKKQPGWCITMGKNAVYQSIINHVAFNSEIINFDMLFIFYN